MTFFGPKYGQDLENRAAHPQQELVGGVPPRGETEQKVLFFAMRLFNLISTNICSRKN